MLLVVGYFEVVQRNSHINPAKNINVATSQTIGRFANEIELAKKSFSTATGVRSAPPALLSHPTHLCNYSLAAVAERSPTQRSGGGATIPSFDS
jgi:hypothetical protein